MSTWSFCTSGSVLEPDSIHTSARGKPEPCGLRDLIRWKESQKTMAWTISLPLSFMSFVGTPRPPHWLCHFLSICFAPLSVNIVGASFHAKWTRICGLLWHPTLVLYLWSTKVFDSSLILTDGFNELQRQVLRASKFQELSEDVQCKMGAFFFFFFWLSPCKHQIQLGS